MKNLKIYLLLFVAVAYTFSSCEEDLEPLNTNFITFADSDYSGIVDPGSTSTVDVTVYTSTITGSDRSFNLSVDGSGAPAGSFSVPESVVVPGGTNEGVFTVQLSDPQNILKNKLDIQLVAENKLYVGEATTVSFTQSCTEITVTLELTLDFYASETSWEVLDAVGETVVSGGSYADGSGAATENFNLCQGRDYTLVVYDSFGDGMISDIVGSYTLSIGGTVVVQENGDFTDSRSTAFSAN